MIERLAGSTLAMAAMLQLSMAAACCGGTTSGTLIPICGDGHRVIELPGAPKKQPANDLPSGCHALCGGRKLAGGTNDRCDDGVA